MAFGFLKKWLSRRQQSNVHILMYTRRGCHLCEDAWTLLRAERQRYGYQLEQAEVDEDAELLTLYGEQVPVVMIDGKLRFRGRVNVVLLRRLLDHREGKP